MLLSFDEFIIIDESNRRFSNELDEYFNFMLSEAVDLKGIIPNPVKYTKIKNNAKKYQKALVQKALADVNYEKKKAKGDITKAQKEVLAKATSAKKEALNDQISAISDRIDDLATSDALKKIAVIAKNKAKVSAVETTLKVADAEESAQLKKRIKNYQQTATNAQKELKDIVNTKAKEQGTAKKSDSQSSNKEANIEQEIKMVNKNYEDSKKSLLKLQRELEELKDDQKRATDPDKYDDKILSVEKSIDDEKEDMAELKKEEARLKKLLSEL